MLNFDPHVWLEQLDAERPSVATVAAVAGGHSKAENCSEAVHGPDKPQKTVIPLPLAEKSVLAVTAATVATPATNLVTETQASATLRDWHGRISRLDDTTAPAGLTYGQWVQRVDDACWLYENFASRAVRDGWSALDLFGLMVAEPGSGGLADRLRGARDLKMDADRAAWTAGGVRKRFCRGDGDDLRAALVLIWEAGR